MRWQIMFSLVLYPGFIYQLITPVYISLIVNRTVGHQRGVSFVEWGAIYTSAVFCWRFIGSVFSSMRELLNNLWWESKSLIFGTISMISLTCFKVCYHHIKFIPMIVNESYRILLQCNDCLMIRYDLIFNLSV